MAGIKRTEADKWFSLCIREAYDWTCNRCGTQYPIGARGLECSHHHGRGNWSVRFEPMNAEALCTGCHFLEGGKQVRLDACLNHLEQELLMEKKENYYYGKEYRKTKGKGEISKYYKQQYEELREMRKEGKRGRLYFPPWL